MAGPAIETGFRFPVSALVLRLHDSAAVVLLQYYVARTCIGEEWFVVRGTWTMIDDSTSQNTYIVDVPGNKVLNIRALALQLSTVKSLYSNWSGE